jgi:chorismate mutase
MKLNDLDIAVMSAAEIDRALDKSRTRRVSLARRIAELRKDLHVHYIAKDTGGLVCEEPTYRKKVHALARVAQLREDMDVVRWPGPDGVGKGTEFGIRPRQSAVGGMRGWVYGHLTTSTVRPRRPT